MEFDLTWILLGLPIVFALGWVASRLDLRQLRIENRQAPRAYFKGLNYLLNEQQDQAIDAFIEAVQKDPDTSELHFALGNLFRRRGEYERAVRVHEHLLSRGDISAADRARAQHALALDFLKAGLIDHAETALRKLEGTSYEQQAGLALLALYERTREWDKAGEIAQKLEKLDQADFGFNRVKEGLLPFVWINDALQATTVPDEAAIYQVCFKAVGASGQSSAVRFVEQPTPFEVVNVNEEVMELKPVEGKVSIE